jgi:hypothetical protein
MLAAIHLLLPGPVEKARLKLEGPLGKVFLLGLVNLVFFGVIGVGLFWLAGLIRDNWSGLAAFLAVLLGLAALVILVTLAIFTLDGFVALASLLGSRIGPAKSPFWSDGRGGLLLVLACLTPYIGWYFFTPVVFCMGLGASILAFLQKKPKVAAK